MTDRGGGRTEQQHTGRCSPNLLAVNTSSLSSIGSPEAESVVPRGLQ